MEVLAREARARQWTKRSSFTPTTFSRATSAHLWTSSQLETIQVQWLSKFKILRNLRIDVQRVFRPSTSSRSWFKQRRKFVLRVANLPLQRKLVALFEEHRWVVFAFRFASKDSTLVPKLLREFHPHWKSEFIPRKFERAARPRADYRLVKIEQLVLHWQRWNQTGKKKVFFLRIELTRLSFVDRLEFVKFKFAAKSTLWSSRLVGSIFTVVKTFNKAV